jgi:hypothetical protein
MKSPAASDGYGEMISLLHSEPPLRKTSIPLRIPLQVPPVAAPVAAPAALTPVEPADEVAQEASEPEFEIVLGRRQVASVALVAVVAMAVFSGVCYLIGRSMGPRAETPVAQEVVPAPHAAAPVVAPAAPDIQPTAAAQIPSEPASPAKVAEASAAPIYADPVQGAVYIQVGAVERGVSTIWAEGLRTHGLDAFVAPGPNEKIFRVLVGPLPTPESFTRVKQILDSIGLATFGKRYQQQ